MNKTFDRKRFISQNSIWLVLFILIIIMGVAQPSFFTVNNLLTLLSGINYLFKNRGVLKDC